MDSITGRHFHVAISATTLRASTTAGVLATHVEPAALRSATHPGTRIALAVTAALVLLLLPLARIRPAMTSMTMLHDIILGFGL